MDFFELIKVIILGVVEGITEWLPISSTGHMILVEQFIQLKQSAAFMEMFRVVIQLGAILAVVVLYFPKLWPFTTAQKGYIKKETFSLWFKVIVGIIPSAIIGIPLDDYMDAHFYNFITVAIALVVYGILFIVIENQNKQVKVHNVKELSYKTALYIGMFQVLSLIPGTSRSGSTILGAMILGTSRPLAAEFSFFLSIPTMFGASLIKLLKFGFNFTGAEFIVLIVGMVVAFVVSIIAIKFLLGYIKKNDFKVFGYYRIVLGIILIGYYLLAIR